jgi:hypothetical protein
MGGEPDGKDRNNLHYLQVLSETTEIDEIGRAVYTLHGNKSNVTWLSTNIKKRLKLRAHRAGGIQYADSTNRPARNGVGGIPR